jgi:hypothetical protein
LILEICRALLNESRLRALPVIAVRQLVPRYPRIINADDEAAAWGGYPEGAAMNNLSGLRCDAERFASALG